MAGASSTAYDQSRDIPFDRAIAEHGGDRAHLDTPADCSPAHSQKPIVRGRDPALDPIGNIRSRVDAGRSSPKSQPMGPTLVFAARKTSDAAIRLFYDAPGSGDGAAASAQIVSNRDGRDLIRSIATPNGC